MKKINSKTIRVSLELVNIIEKLAEINARSSAAQLEYLLKIGIVSDNQLTRDEITEIVTKFSKIKGKYSDTEPK